MKCNPLKLFTHKIARHKAQNTSSIQYNRPAHNKSFFSPYLSDHKMYFNAHTGHLTWNIMMQGKVSIRAGKKRANTAFEHEELDIIYQMRLDTVVIALAAQLKNNPAINIISLQEGPIAQDYEYFKSLVEQHFPPEWQLNHAHIYVDNTRWGVITIINLHRIRCTQINLIDLTRELSIIDIDVRCRSFSLINENSHTMLTTVHLPHDNPKEAFKLIFERILRSMHQKNSKSTIEYHDLLGDLNIEINELDELMKDGINSFNRSHQDKFKINISVCPSIKGHLKADGSVLTVDYLIRIVMTPAAENEYTINYRLFKDMASLLIPCSIIAGSGIMFSEEITDNTSLENINEPAQGISKHI